MSQIDLHYKFIKTPIYTVLEESCNACRCIERGIEMYPLKEYILQNIFLRMTGFQEQKLKCICWSIAKDNYDFRFQYQKDNFNELSSIEDKNKLYKLLVEAIIDFDEGYTIDNESKINIINGSKQKISDLLNNSILIEWEPSDFQDYDDLSGVFNSHIDDLSKNKTLIVKNTELYNIYKKSLYRHRNRCAHNLLSYQENLPSLRKLSMTYNKYNNYFFWFLYLTIIDEFFMNIFTKYEGYWNLYGDL